MAILSLRYKSNHFGTEKTKLVRSDRLRRARKQPPDPHAQSNSGEGAHLGLRQTAPHVPLLLRLRAGFGDRPPVRQAERFHVHRGLLTERFQHERDRFLEIGTQVGDPCHRWGATSDPARLSRCPTSSPPAAGQVARPTGARETRIGGTDLASEAASSRQPRAAAGTLRAAPAPPFWAEKMSAAPSLKIRKFDTTSGTRILRFCQLIAKCGQFFKANHVDPETRLGSEIHTPKS